MNHNKIGPRTDRGIDVLREILIWSASRPDWQRDAIKRLIIKGELDRIDIEELTTQCKAKYGLAEKTISKPLKEHDIPKQGSELDIVKILSITHQFGVNALARGQTIKFCPELTIVYGANAAGKSGYARILKRACRARGTEKILGNVLAESSPIRPSAEITFLKGDKENKFFWNDQDDASSPLGHVCVFDSYCASIYIKEKTDVAFRPYGLDIFDKLSDACEEVRKVLDEELRILKLKGESLPKIPEGTEAYRLIFNITSLTNPEEVKKLGTLTEDERERMKQLHKRLKDLQAEDPNKVAKVLSLRAQRLETLGNHLAGLDKFLSDTSLDPIFRAKDAFNKRRNAVEKIKKLTFPTGLLNGTGSDLWRELWEAARQFSTKSVYPELQFPATTKDSRCLLCQQELKDEAVKLLKGFEEFVKSSVQQEFEKTKVDYEKQKLLVENLKVEDQGIQESVAELQIEDDLLAKRIQECLKNLQTQKTLVLKALQKNEAKPIELRRYKQYSEIVLKEANALRTRAKRLMSAMDSSTKEALFKEFNESEAREILGKHQNIIINEINRRKKIAAYQLCLNDTGTHTITRKSTEITKLAVTKQLAKAFQTELRDLGFSHLEVELKAIGGTRGILYHKLVLKRAESIDLPLVLSEGEARALSIAAFFAELSTASHRSAILFDDPVSSLDHQWRDNVARRLASEAKVRQVVVFTHDIVFLHALVRWAEKASVPCTHQYVKRESEEAGIASSELPWVAMKVNERIGKLKELWQKADKLYRTEKREVYEKEAKHIYGLLREAWERGLEEVLLGGIVERFRPSIQTQQAKHLSDIIEDDCKVLEEGITKCSRWLPGHDQAPAENITVPDPAELKRDIESLENWKKTINKRRK